MAAVAGNSAHEHGRPIARRAFTLIELLIVVVVIGIVISMITAAGARLVHGSKVSTTRAIIGNVSMALDEFAQLNPLRRMYDAKTTRSFGPYVPYQLDRSGAGGGLHFSSLESNPPNGPNGTLWNRFERDFFSAAPGALVRPNPSSPPPTATAMNVGLPGPNDDIRSLHAYLRVFVPDALAKVPAQYVKPLPGAPAGGEFMNMSGDTTDSELNLNKRSEILGIYDAFGVPLDYFLYVKIERGPQNTVYMKDRRPGIRSRGITAEEFRIGVSRPSQWLFNEPFPQPATDISNTGTLVPSTLRSGWFRARAAGETYGFVPSQDN